MIEKNPIRALSSINEPIEYGKSFSRGVKVGLRGINMIFISGTASIDEKGKTFCPGNFSAQLKRTFGNISALLKSSGANWQDIVQTRCYLKNMKRDYAEFNLIRNKFYKEQGLKFFPSSVCVEANLCRPELLVEIEALAILEFKRKKSRTPLKGS